MFFNLFYINTVSCFLVISNSLPHNNDFVSSFICYDSYIIIKFFLNFHVSPFPNDIFQDWPHLFLYPFQQIHAKIKNDPIIYAITYTIQVMLGFTIAIQFKCLIKQSIAHYLKRSQSLYFLLYPLP